MPKLNTNNEEVIQYFCKICEDWVREFDIDGIRFDVGNEVSHRFLNADKRAFENDKGRIFIFWGENSGMMQASGCREMSMILS